MKNERVYKMKFSKVYPLYIQKVERKGRMKEEVDTVINSAKEEQETSFALLFNYIKTHLIISL